MPKRAIWLLLTVAYRIQTMVAADAKENRAEVIRHTNRLSTLAAHRTGCKVSALYFIVARTRKNR
jgi:hypothetical protein